MTGELLASCSRCGQPAPPAALCADCESVRDEELGPPIPGGGHEGPNHPACRECGRALGYHADDLSTLCAYCGAEEP